ncbi:MAG: sulfotransferase [bacterium]|nr:sulfotransferase [bacterium]
MTDAIQTPVFVVSSGRAGSTLLAKMINRHPRLLCVSDLFEPVGEVPYFDRQRRADGRELFEILSAPSFEQRIRYWRSQPTTELLFLPEEDRMVSLLLCYTLPFLTEGDPMDLYHRLRSAAEEWPEDTMPGHLIRFFDWLRDIHGKDLWVERTGGSLPHMKKIVEAFPDAKIVHSYRDCRETAISMMTGSFFRLYFELDKNPDLGEWDWNTKPPLEEMGAMLNRWVVDADAALETVPEDRKMGLAYEDLLDDAAGTLLRLVGFIFDRDEPTPEDVAWAERERAVIRRPPLKFPGLDRGEQQRLEAACSEGLWILGYARSCRPYDYSPAFTRRSTG